jgi:hypothetical protein
MLTRAQQILIKRAQQEARLDDADYRSAIATVSGHGDCTSSKDARLTDQNVDNLLSYFEAIHWRKVDAGELQASCKPTAVFRKKGYWAAKNTRGNTSRDRHVAADLAHQVVALEDELARLGCGFAYFSKIQNNIVPFSVPLYLCALKRTLAAKQKKSANVAASDAAPW